jgi:regulatory protein
MFITEIKKDKLHLMRVFLNDGNEVLIDKDVCKEKCLKKGMELDGLEEIIFESDYRRAKSRAIWYLDRTDHTEKALYDKLLRAGFKPKPCAKVIARLKEVGLLDDNRYAENYANRLIESNVSKREALQKLLLKGVPYDLAKSVLEETQTDELSQIKNVIEKKYKNKLLAENGVQKVYAALVRKGFSYGAVKTALNEFIEESEE